MKIFTIFRSGKYGPLQKTMLLLALILAGVVLFQQIAWAYHQVQSGMGHEMAQIAIAFHVLLLLGMIAVGIGLGYLVDRMIRQQRFVFRSPHKGGWAEIFINLWGYELKCGEEAVREIVPPSDPIPGCDETLAFLDLPARRGRKPTFPLERWLPIAVQWENRDPIPKFIHYHIENGKFSRVVCKI